MQRKGIGTALVRHAVEQARRLACYKVILNCQGDRVGFYTRLGFGWPLVYWVQALAQRSRGGPAFPPIRLQPEHAVEVVRMVRVPGELALDGGTLRLVGPLEAAAQVWPYTPIGTLVTIEN